MGAPDALRLTPPQAILFDWDMTLVDSFRVVHQALSATLVDFGLPPWTYQETLARAQKSARDQFPEIFGADRWQSALERFYDYFLASHLDQLTPLEGTESLLQKLNQYNLYLAVVSNKRGELLRREVAHLKWEKYFSMVVGAEDAPRDKPAQEPVEMALRKSTLAPGSHVWLVGDSRVDMVCAVQSGCSPILLRNAPPVQGEFDDAPLACYVKTCNNLLSLVETHVRAERRGGETEESQ